MCFSSEHPPQLTTQELIGKEIIVSVVSFVRTCTDWQDETDQYVDIHRSVLRHLVAKADKQSRTSGTIDQRQLKVSPAQDIVS